MAVLHVRRGQSDRDIRRWGALKVSSSWTVRAASPCGQLLKGIVVFLCLSDVPDIHDNENVILSWESGGDSTKHSNNMRKCLRAEPKGAAVNPKGIWFGHCPRMVESYEAS